MLGYLGQQFWKTIVIFEVSALGFVLLQSLIQKLKSLNLGTKMPDLGIFRLELENNIALFEISAVELV